MKYFLLMSALYVGSLSYAGSNDFPNADSPQFAGPFELPSSNELCTYSVSGDTKDVSGDTDCGYTVYIRGGEDNMDIRTFRSSDIINVSIGEFQQEHRNTFGTGKAFVLKDLQDCSFCKKKKVSFRFDKQDRLVEMNEIDLDADVFKGQSRFPDIKCSGYIKVTERRCH